MIHTTALTNNRHALKMGFNPRSRRLGIQLDCECGVQHELRIDLKEVIKCDDDGSDVEEPAEAGDEE